MMRSKLGLALIAGVLLACSTAGVAEDRGYWRAASTTASTITGDINIASNKITINFSSFPLAPIRALAPAEVAAAFNADANAGANGYLYRLSIPADKRFLHHNTLCGTEDTEWMATYMTGRNLEVKFFSGSDQPVFTVDALNNSAAVCGAFTYAR